jgi:hypothetical protein
MVTDRILVPPAGDSTINLAAGDKAIAIGHRRSILAKRIIERMPIAIVLLLLTQQGYILLTAIISSTLLTG